MKTVGTFGNRKISGTVEIGNPDLDSDLLDGKSDENLVVVELNGLKIIVDAMGQVFVSSGYKDGTVWVTAETDDDDGMYSWVNTSDGEKYSDRTRSVHVECADRLVITPAC